MNCEVSSASVSANGQSSQVLTGQTLITTNAALENHSEKVGWHYGGVKFTILLIMVVAITGCAINAVDPPLAPNPNLATEYTPAYYDQVPPEDPAAPELAYPPRKDSH